MKKLTSILTLVLVLVMGMTMAACTTPQTDPEPVAPEGYQLYDNDKFTFAYPENWTKTDGSVVMLINETGVGNNITVAYEAKSDIYATMTAETFATTLKPVLDAAGISTSNVAVSQTKNKNNVQLTKITYDAAANGVSMKQTLFVLAVDNYNYVLTVTETTADTELVETVFNTLALSK